ncbi:hypothetical protein BH24ACT15_BH24ACT15_08870 [soil metagenome]
MSDKVRFSSVTFASPNPAELAAFYADVTGGHVTFVHESEWQPCDTTAWTQPEGDAIGAGCDDPEHV